MNCSSEGWTISHDGGVATVALGSPANGSPLDRDTAQRLLAFLRRADAEPDVRCVVVTGRGDDFCTGTAMGDAALDGRSPLDVRHWTDLYRELFGTYWRLETPVVSAVNGSVAGPGWALALLADLVVAAQEARWTYGPEGRLLGACLSDAYYLPRVMPFPRLVEIASLSEPLPTARLHSWGLVNRAVPRTDVMPVAMKLAVRLAAGPTRSLGLTKQLYRRSLDGDQDATLADERNVMALASTTGDVHGAVAAIREERSMQSPGR